MATGVSVAERLCLWADGPAATAAVTGTLPVRSLSVDDIDRFGDRERGFDISCMQREGRKEGYAVRRNLGPRPWLRENLCLADRNSIPSQIQDTSRKGAFTNREFGPSKS